MAWYRLLATASLAAGVAGLSNADKGHEEKCLCPETAYVQDVEVQSLTPVLVAGLFPHETNIVIDEGITVDVTEVAAPFHTVVTKTNIITTRR